MSKELVAQSSLFVGSIWAEKIIFSLTNAIRFDTQMSWRSIVFPGFLLLLLAVESVQSYYVSVDAYSEECFFEKLTSGTKLVVTYEVIEGGSLDIDMTVNNAMLRSISLTISIFRSLDPIRKRSSVAITNPAAKPPSRHTWMAPIHYVSVIVCRQWRRKWSCFSWMWAIPQHSICPRVEVLTMSQVTRSSQASRNAQFLSSSPSH